MAPASGFDLGEDEARRLLRTMPEALIIVDAAGRVRGASVAGERRAASGGQRWRTWLASALSPVIDELEADLAPAPRCVRTTLSEGDGFQALVQSVGPDRFAVRLPRQELGAAGLHQALMDRLGLTAADARLALRAARGDSNRSIAQAFGLPLGTVKSRLNRLYELLDVSRRSALLLAMGQALALDRAPLPAADPLPPAAREPGPARELRGWLEAVGVALAAVGASGELRWANPEARRWLRPGPGGTAVARLGLDRIAAQVCAGAPGARAVLRLRTGAAVVRAEAWRVSAALAGVILHPERLPEAEVRELLSRRFALSSQQARVAVQIARGLGNAEIARALGAKEGLVRVVSAVVYAKLGVRGRLGLTSLLAELGLGRERRLGRRPLAPAPRRTHTAASAAAGLESRAAEAVTICG